MVRGFLQYTDLVYYKRFSNKWIFYDIIQMFLSLYCSFRLCWHCICCWMLLEKYEKNHIISFQFLFRASFTAFCGINLIVHLSFSIPRLKLNCKDVHFLDKTIVLYFWIYISGIFFYWNEDKSSVSLFFLFTFTVFLFFFH